MDREGPKEAAFGVDLTRAVRKGASMPMVASGGVGDLQQLMEGGKRRNADMVPDAGILHFAAYAVGAASGFMQ